MKTTRRKNILRYGFIVAIAFCLTLFGATVSLKDSIAHAEEVPEAVTYHIGDVIEAKSYDIPHGEGTVKAEGLTVVYPSGGVYGGDMFEIENAGRYDVTYYATVNGERVEATESYLAVRRPQDIIIGEEGMEIGYGKYFVESPYELKKDTYGAKVIFKAGQTITFNTNIKTANLTKDYDIFDLIVMPSSFGETDFERLTVRVTDVNDKNNYVEILIDSSNMVDGNGQISYVKAGAAGQQPGGYEGSDFLTNNYGAPVEHSFRALGRAQEFREYVTVSECSVTLSIDNAERKVYCGPVSNVSVDKVLVNDLDDPAHYKSNPWGGFTSDEVTVTITAGAFIKSQGTVILKRFGDFDLSKDIIDDKAPEINLLYDKTQKLPVAVVGESFPIIPFDINDALDSNVNTKVQVYHVDSANNALNVYTDGTSFVAKHEGKHVIVYYAEDYSGNSTVEYVEIDAVKSTPNILIAIDKPLIEEEAYHTVTIPQASDMKVYGGSGSLNVSRVVYDPDKNVLDVKDKLQLAKLGDYKVVFTVEDYLGNVEYGVITIRSKATEKPYFVEEPYFDSMLLSGFSYELSQPRVIEVVDGVIKDVACKVYVNDSLKEGSFVASGEQITIRYVAEGQTGTTEWEEVFPVSDTSKGKYRSKYFYTEDDIQILDEKNFLQFVFSQDSKVEFVNALGVSEEGFSINFSYEQEFAKFSNMQIILFDETNRNERVTFNLYYDETGDAWFIQLNGKKDKINFVVTNKTLKFSYKADNRQITDTSGVAVDTVTKYDSGEPFNGFTGRLYLQIAFGGVMSESKINLTQICNQTMGYNKSSIEKALDDIEPIIVLSEEFTIRQKLGSKAIIPVAQAFDVLGYVTEFTVTVARENGDVVASGNASQAMDFVLDQAGKYRVTYFAKDNSGNSKKIPYNILVNDETAPELKVKGKIKEEYKLGAKIKLPKYSAEDNGENCYIQVTLILPNNEMRLLHYVENGELTSLLSEHNKLYENSFKEDENTFIATKAGNYVLRIVAYDEYYNCTTKEFEFTVK